MSKQSSLSGLSTAKEEEDPEKNEPDNNLQQTAGKGVERLYVLQGASQIQH